MVQRAGASRDSPNDALWDLDAFHGDEFLQLIQTGHILYLTAELGAVTRASYMNSKSNWLGFSFKSETTVACCSQ